MPRTIQFDGMTFGSEEVKSLREEVIHIRDEALRQNAFKESIILSHTVALMYHLAEILQEDQTLPN